MKTVFALCALALFCAAAPAAAAPYAVSAPSISHDREGLRVRGEVCRVGPRPAVSTERLVVNGLDAAGHVVGPPLQTAGPALTARNARCAFYVVHPDWRSVSAVEVCVDAASGRVCAQSPAG